MRNLFKKLFYHWAYLDFTGTNKKEDTYFYRFSQEIGQSNLRMMRNMSTFMLIISLFVIASTFTYFAETSLRKIYIVIILLELVLLCVIQWLLQKEFPARICTVLTAAHLFHMLLLGGYIGVFYCQKETALVFLVVLTISSMIYSLPTMLTMGITTICTIATVIASYYFKESYWFESDVLNGIAVLIFSFMFGWRINCIRAEEAFARANVLRLNNELKKISITDPLTGLRNHRSFQDSYYEMFHRARAQALPLGVIMMDLDHFKSFNDHYGHVAGDDCLSSVGSAIAASVPKEAVVCRYGGEEFIVLLNEKLCYQGEAIGEAIRTTVAALGIPHTFTGLEAQVVTLSLGMYVGTPSNNEQPMNFVERADKAMYQSKEHGRNRLTVVYEDSMDTT